MFAWQIFCESTSGETDWLFLWRVESARTNRVDSSTFNAPVWRFRKEEGSLKYLWYSDNGTPAVSRFKDVEGSCCHFLFLCYSFSHFSISHTITFSTSGMLTYDSTSGIPYYSFSNIAYHSPLPVWCVSIPVCRFVNDRRRIVAVWVYWTCIPIPNYKNEQWLRKKTL